MIYLTDVIKKNHKLVDFDSLMNKKFDFLLTIKNIIKTACEVTITLYNWLSPWRNCVPGDDNSNLIMNDNAVPINPANTANIK